MSPLSFKLPPSTEYAEKRRLLREHRAEMRLTQALLQGYGLLGALKDRIIQVTGNTGFYLGHCEMDEGSDAEDPELQAKNRIAEARDEQCFIQAVAGALEHGRLRAELARAHHEIDGLRQQADAGGRHGFDQTPEHRQSHA